MISVVALNIVPGSFPVCELGNPLLDAADGLEQLWTMFGHCAPERREVPPNRIPCLRI